MRSRRGFLRRLAILAGGLLFQPRLVLSNPGPGPFASLEDLVGERLQYDLSFLWFDKAASGSIQFLRDGDGFKAVLEAETMGFVGFLTSYRRHVYISHLSYLPQEKKLRSHLFERLVIIRKREERTITHLDYAKRLMRWEIFRNGKLKGKKSKPIAKEREYEDILSAFFNVRLGYFGPVRRGRSFAIDTIPEKGQTSIEVHVIDREEAIRDKDLFGEGFREDLIYIKLKVPKEIFKSKTGEVCIWVDERIIPIRGVVKDYIGFGDIRGILRDEGAVVRGQEGE